MDTKEIFEIIVRSLYFALAGTALSMLTGVPLGMALGKRTGGISRTLAAFFGSLAAMPTVVMGLLLYLLLSRSGPLGALQWLYGSPGVIVGEFLLGLPIVVYHIYSGMKKIDSSLDETLRQFGSSRLQSVFVFTYECLPLIAGAFVLSFGRTIGEVGLAMMIGGNIRHVTRTMTTAIALETAKGNVYDAIWLGLILMIIALFINFAIQALQKHE